MPEQVVTISKVFRATGSNARGTWTRFDIKDAGGNKFSTFDEALGRQAEEAQGQAVTLHYVEKPSKDGKYVNLEVTGLTYLDGASVNTTGAQTETNDERQLRIMRQSALERAINAVTLLGIEVSSVEDLYAVADEFVDYFVNGAPVPA